MLGDLSRRDWIVLSVVWSAAFALAVMMLFRGGLSGAGLAFIGMAAFGGALFFSVLAERPAQAEPSAPEQPAPARREPAPAQSQAAKEPGSAQPTSVVAPAAAAAPEPAAAAAPEGDKPAMLPAPRDGGADDLKRIKGVGPKLEAQLNRMGVHHFDQIAAWTPREVAWVDENLEGLRGRVTRDGWVDQARVLAGGGETAFSTRVAQGEVPTSRA